MAQTGYNKWSTIYYGSSSSTVSATSEPSFDIYRPAQKRRINEVREEPVMKKNFPEFEVGARVVIMSNPKDHEALKGKTAIIIYSAYPTVCVEFGEPIEGGHAGPVRAGKNGHCWNINVSHLLPSKGHVVYEISQDIEIGGKSMKGREVEILTSFTSEKEALSVVEFKENVGGHSGDGLGKKGFCWTVPTKAIRMVEKEKAEKSKKGEN